MKTTVFGLDLAKTEFHVVGLNQAGKEGAKKKLKRGKVLDYFRQQDPALVAMEACAAAHYWAREIEGLGHQVMLLPPQAVKPYLLGSKNDYNDALAIAEASGRPKIHGVRVRSVEEQALQGVQRLRELQVKQRTALGNCLRGLLGEVGIVVAQGLAQLRTALPGILEDAENGVPDLLRQALNRSYQQLRQLDEDIDQHERQIKAAVARHEDAQRLLSVPGFGPIITAAFISSVGDGKQFQRGRDVSAFLGLVPRQHSTGGKNVLLGITKHGNTQLRSLLVHGARSVLQHAGKKQDRLSRWAVQLEQRVGWNKAVVAIANKIARIAWAVLTSGGTYQAQAA